MGIAAIDTALATSTSGDVAVVVCHFVQQMMDQCGEELQKCFSQEQISTTKRKQEEQLALALSDHFPDFGSKCLEASSDNAIIDKIVPSEMNNADNRRLGKTVEIDTSQLSQRPSSAGGATTWPLAILFSVLNAFYV